MITTFEILKSFKGHSSGNGDVKNLSIGIENGISETIKASGLATGISLSQLTFFKIISYVEIVAPPRAVAYNLNLNVYEIVSISGI